MARKRANPQDNQKRTRRHLLSVRLTEEELFEIKDKARFAGMTLTDWLLSASREQEIIQVEGLADLYLELSRQGNNLNQIARLLHQQQEVIWVKSAIQENEKLKKRIGFLMKNTIPKRRNNNGNIDSRIEQGQTAQSDSIYPR
ncbi:MAG: plasmid mobilization relaxosome protein MobC [Clostridia bacterium]|nr:plasmid mobilization relaxosome protein MobC [Clostridia bacterium]